MRTVSEKIHLYRIQNKPYTECMQKKTVSAEIIMHLAAVLILITATGVSIYSTPDPYTIIPKVKITVPIINALCAVLAFVLLFIPRNTFLECAILAMQAVTTCLTGYESLGIFLYTAMILILFCDGFFKKHAFRRILILFVAWFLVLPGIIPHGIERYILAITQSIFTLAFYCFIYKKLETLLKPLMTLYIPESTCPAVKDIKKGDKLSLTSCGLNEREVQFTFDFLVNNKTYRQIADEQYVSISTVKKVMADVLKKIGVRNQNDLKILLLQYKIER